MIAKKSFLFTYAGIFLQSIFLMVAYLLFCLLHFIHIFLIIVLIFISSKQLKKEGRKNDFERHKLEALNQRQKMVMCFVWQKFM